MAATPSTLTTFDGLLKERYYDSSVVEKLVYPENTLLGMLEKRGDTGMVGDQLPIPIITGVGQGVGHTFSVAQGRSTPLTTGKFVATAGDYHAVVNISEKVIMASRTNAGAFLEAKMLEIDGVHEQAGENLSIYVWGNGGSALGRRESISGDTVTLVNKSDAANFEINMSVVASADDGSGTGNSLRTNSATVLVESLNRATGEVTLDDQSQIGSFANGDYLFRESDFYGNSGNIVIVGLQAFISATDSPPLLWGVAAATRATDPQRWGGCRVLPSELAGKSIEERIKILEAQKTSRFKGKKSTAYFLNPEDFVKLDTLMSAQGKRDLQRDTTKFGYESITIATPSGKIPIYSDRHCPIGQTFAFRMENHWITSMGELFYNQPGGGPFDMLVRDASTNLEYRLISHPIYACNAPLHMARAPLYT